MDWSGLHRPCTFQSKGRIEVTKGINRRDSLTLMGALAPLAATSQNAAAQSETEFSESATFLGLSHRSIEKGTGALLTSGFAVPGIGGGVYRRCTEGPFIATRWRRKSRDGQWFEKDERDVDLTHMGATGDGKDSTEAMLAAFAWLNEHPGRQLQVPRGQFVTSADLPILADNAALVGQGHSGSEIVLANGATIRVGRALTRGRAADGRLLRTINGKVLFPRIENLAVKAAGEHTQDCIVLEHADNAILRLLDVSQAGITAHARVNGIRTRWVQWTTLDHVFVNTNDSALTIELASETDENEDHFLINACQFYIGKQPVRDASPACIRIECGVGRSAPMWNFHVTGRTHFLGWKAADNLPATTGPIFTSGVMLVQPNTGAALRMATIRDAFFEDVSFPIDLRRGVTGADVSTIHTQGCSFMEAHTVFSGRDWSKHGATAADNHYINGGFVADGNIRLYHRGYSRMSGMQGFDRQGLTGVHQWERRSFCVEGIELEAAGSIEVPAGANNVTIDYRLSVAEDARCRATSLIANWPGANPWPVSIGSRRAVIRFIQPPAQGGRLQYCFEA